MLATTMTTTMARPIAIFIGLPKHGVVDMLTLLPRQRTVHSYNTHYSKSRAGTKNVHIFGQHSVPTLGIYRNFQELNNMKGVTVEFIESEYDKVIYQAFIKPRNK